MIVNKLSEYYRDTGKMFRRIIGEPIETSSTDIRKRVEQGEDISELVPPLVASYIKSNGLYQRKN
jgi:nicotinic acid mononucleotide adenylyltransferase